MKKIITVITILIVNLSLFSQSTVTFRVDMSEYDGPIPTMEIGGSFNDWCGSCAFLTDDDSDGIYELAIEMENDDYEFKYHINNWDVQEVFAPGTPCTLTSGQFVNRTLNVTGDTVLDVVCWESCGDCDAPPTSGDVTFRVDMSDYTGSFDVVNLNGTFNNWCGVCAPMDDSDDDDVYEITVNLPLGLSEFKFTLNGWDVAENLPEGSCTLTTDGYTNRSIIVEDDILLPIYCWEACENCNVGIGEKELADLISISPNPSSGNLIISGNYQLEATSTITISNSLGETIKSLTLNLKNQVVLDLNNESEGLYFVSIENAGITATKRIVLIK